MTNAHSDQSKAAGPNEIFPVLPLRDIVVFPYMIVPLFVGREKSINALDEVMRTDRQILLAAQKNAGGIASFSNAIRIQKQRIANFQCFLMQLKFRIRNYSYRGARFLEE